MNNKDKYKKAMDYNKASDELKRKTIQKLKEEPKQNSFAWIPKFAVVFLLVLSIAWLANESEKPPILTPEDVIPVAKKINLPTVDSEENLEKILKDKGVLANQTNGMWGDTIDYSVSEKAVKSDNTTPTSSNMDFSRTNNQVENVEEADNVKTDGKYIYSIGENEVSITDIQNPEQMQKLASISYERTETTVCSPRELYVYKDKLVVIANINTLYTINNKPEAEKNSIYYDRMAMQSTIKAFIYDITDRSNVKLEREVEVDGYYMSSRMIESNLYIIANQFIQISTLEGELYTRPAYNDTIKNTEKVSIPYNSIYYFPDSEDSNYLNILTVDINSKKEAKLYSFLGAGENVYANEQSLYIANQKYKVNRDDKTGIRNFGDVYTEFYKFSINDQELEYIATAITEGSIINQFSMDEDAGFFRVAITKNGESIEDRQNCLYVYDSNMNIVGKLEELAKGERIHSARFMQDRLYLVTYKDIDPLFVIDLQNPYLPKVLGELKIPGVSEYLHPYDKTHLIGIGRNTKETNGVAKEIGMKISLFDVGDVNNPKELSSFNIGEQGTHSEILYNHKALFFDKTENTVGFAIQMKEGSDYFTGAVFYNIDIENGITEKARIEDNSKKDYKSRIQRILYSNNSVYTISENTIISTNRSTLKKISSITL